MEVNHERLPSLAAFGLMALRSGSDPTRGPLFLDCLQPVDEPPLAQPAENMPPPPPQTSVSDHSESTVDELDANSEQEEPLDEESTSDESSADPTAAPVAQMLPVADNGDGTILGKELANPTDDAVATQTGGAVAVQPSPAAAIDDTAAASTNSEEQPVVFPIPTETRLPVAGETSEENVQHSEAAISVSMNSQRDKVRPQKTLDNPGEPSDDPGEKPSIGRPDIPVGQQPEDAAMPGVPEVAPLEAARSEDASRSSHVKEISAPATEVKSTPAPVESTAPAADAPASSAQAASNPSAAAAASAKPLPVLLKAKPGNADAARAAGEIDPAKFLSRVAKAFESAHQRGSEVRLRLHPAELGALSIEVRIHDSVLTARVQAETPDAKAAIIDNLPALRERLADQGIRIDKFDVDLMDHSDQRQQSLQEQARRQDDRQAGAPRSSGRRAAITEQPPVPSPLNRASSQGGLNVVI